MHPALASTSGVEWSGAESVPTRQMVAVDEVWVVQHVGRERALPSLGRWDPGGKQVGESRATQHAAGRSLVPSCGADPRWMRRSTTSWL